MGEYDRMESHRWSPAVMPDVLTRIRPTLIPPEVRMLQLAVAAALDDVAIADDRWIYHTSLNMARRLHELGARMIEISS